MLPVRSAASVTLSASAGRGLLLTPGESTGEARRGRQNGGDGRGWVKELKGKGMQQGTVRGGRIRRNKQMLTGAAQIRL